MTIRARPSDIPAGSGTGVSGPSRAERGDFQTPPALAAAALARLAGTVTSPAPKTIVEPTCGLGAFLRAAEPLWPTATLHGWDVCEAYLHEARRGLLRPAHLRHVDVFSLCWQDELAALPEPIWIVGNPPWVTVSKLGARDGNAQPERSNTGGLNGWQARTGAANFDVSEWLLRRWLHALQGRPFVVAVICKTHVARKLLQVCVRERWGVQGSLYGIDARRAFGVAVSAVWLVLTPSPARSEVWPVYADLTSETPVGHLGLRGGEVVADTQAFDATEGLRAAEPLPWRSGIKHDAAEVMELRWHANGTLFTRAGMHADLEAEWVYPLLKGTDLHHDRLRPERAILVPQRKVGEPTTPLREQAPRTWAYLQEHRQRLAARRSRIYAGQPDFAVFGVGPYTFAPWKVAVSGLHREPRFRAVGPANGRPVLFDDTCYLLPFDHAEAAHAAAAFLNGPEAQRFLAARSFADAKRPITQRLLCQLALPAAG